MIIIIKYYRVTFFVSTMIHRVLSTKYKLIQSSKGSLNVHLQCLATNSNTFPSQSRVVIAGAGVVANSVAYHLVESGWQDVTVIEQRKIGSGTSHFGSGILGLFKPISHRNVIW